MTNSEIIIAKRLEIEMSRVANNADKIAKDSGYTGAPYQQAMHFFMGLGLALAICFEESTGKKAIEAKPQDIMLWARGLPEPERREPLKSVRD